VGLVLAGFALWASVPGVDAYLLPVIALVVVSLIPLALEILRERRRHAGRAAEPVVGKVRNRVPDVGCVNPGTAVEDGGPTAATG
jgi:hypothetical protein